ncbi:hypothetical protein EZV62_000433 [Acer yangbiense]|uniref:Uncharacterized protein n=1 Tax=Acer yangbiense TaxID=1000413 RepID=A0A5C7ISN7_9ROSI|nr:hypothetical protein EZV62_000433 [Acer yangbiense]
MSADMAAGSNAGLHVLQFFGENYYIWTVKMKSYLKAFGLWEYVAEDKQVPPLRANPTIAKMNIMHLKTSKSIWDELKSRFEGSERVKLVKLLTLKREFENLKMKDSETVKDYSSKLSELVNQMRLYGDVTEDYKVVEKMLVTQEQRLALRNDGDMNEAFLAMNKGKHKGKGKMDTIWYVDSGCTSHMARDESMFTTFDRNATTTVKLGNGDTSKAAEKDSKKSEIVRVKMHDNSFPIDFNRVKQKVLISKHDMVRDKQAISRTYDLCDAYQIGKLHRKPNMNEDFDGDSSSGSDFDDGAVADGKTRSLADVYEKCNMMVNEPSCYEEAAQMNEWKLAMKEELMMINKNQAQSSVEVEYIAAAANQAT